MDNLFIKKAVIFTFAAAFILGAFSILAFLYKAAYPMANGQVQQQTALVTVFAPTGHPPVVTLTSAQADSSKLTVTLAVSGLELVKNPDDFENMICDPYLQTDPPLQWIFKSRESRLPEKVGGPIIIIYEYGIKARSNQDLNIEMTFTIGPCRPHIQNANATPHPTVDLIANYKLAFTVRIN